MINGTRLKDLREQAGLSAAQLGDSVGVSASAILHTERGFDKLGLKSLTLIAERLGASLDDLVKKKEEQA